MTEPTRSPDNYRDATERATLPDWMQAAYVTAHPVVQHLPSTTSVTAADMAPVAWAHRYTRSEMTTGEADAWRAAVAECKRKSYQYAAHLRASVEGRDDETAAIVRANASAIEMCADQFDRIEPRAEATGLCERGA